jgi:hypothetical protein
MVLMKLFLISISIPIGVMLSPETLILLGNSAGYNGMIFFLSVAASALVCFLCAGTIFSTGGQKGQENELSLLAKAIGRLPGASLVLSARLSMTLLAATSVLVIAGFAFNEIFLYWFPNFGFAFLLLGLILISNLLRSSWAGTLQLLLVACSLVSFSILLINGLFSAPSSDLTTLGSEPTSLAAATGAVLLFLGFDLILNSEQKNKLFPAVAAISTIFVLFVLWGAVSRMHVPATSLTESTLPHLKAARAVMGQNGRLLMGIVVICGATAAVNGLFLYMGQTVRGLAGQDLLPPLKGETLHRLASILMAVTIGVFMMTGLAGDDKLTIYYRGALLLWLVLLAARCGAMALQPSVGRNFSIIGVAAGCTMAIASIILCYTAESSSELIVFGLLAYASGLLLVMAWPALVKLFPKLKR